MILFEHIEIALKGAGRRPTTRKKKTVFPAVMALQGVAQIAAEVRQTSGLITQRNVFIHHHFGVLLDALGNVTKHTVRPETLVEVSPTDQMLILPVIYSNRKFFFDTVYLSLFDCALRRAQVQGLTCLPGYCEQHLAAKDDR